MLVLLPIAETMHRVFQETVVKPLLPLITRELKHCIQFGAKRKSLEVGTRLTCGEFGDGLSLVRTAYHAYRSLVRSMFDDPVRWKLVLCRMRQRILL